MSLIRALALLLFLTSTGPPLASGQEGPTGHLEAGEAALAERNWADAEMSFRRAIAEAGAAVSAHVGLARALAGGGQVEQARTGIVGTSRRWMAAADYAEAEELLGAGVELMPDDSALLALLGRSRVLGRRYLAAEAPLARIHERGEADLDTLLFYAAALWENGRMEKAERVLREAVTGSGGAFPAVYQLGRLLLWTSRYEEAADLLGRCASQAPRAADVQLDLARALDGAGRSEQALGVFRQAVALAPEHSEMRYGLAMALMRTGDRDGARVELETYGELYEREQEQTRQAGLERARVALGRELVRQGRTEEAVAHLSDLPQSADSLAALAAALRAGGDLEGAAARLADAVALEPERTDLRALLNETRLELLRRP